MKEKLPVICGIYKITSPSVKIYVGESYDIYERWRIYKRLHCKKQPRLYNSLKKHGWEAHTFEILEECDFDALPCRERHWQDEYDVLGKNGLNCRLTECGDKKRVVSEETLEKMREVGKALAPIISERMKGEGNPMYGLKGELNPRYGTKWSEDTWEKFRNSNRVYKKGEDHHAYGIPKTDEAKAKVSASKMGKKKGAESHWSKKVVHTQAEEIYVSVEAVSKKFNLVYDTLKAKLNGQNKNDTYFMYLVDYLKYGAQEPATLVSAPLAVRDTKTLKKYPSVSQAAKDLGIGSQLLIRYLNGDRKNKTYCVYEKDYIEGVVHEPYVRIRERKVTEEISNTTYDSPKLAAAAHSININTMRGYLTGNKQPQGLSFKYADNP